MESGPTWWLEWKVDQHNGWNGRWINMMVGMENGPTRWLEWKSGPTIWMDR